MRKIDSKQIVERIKSKHGGSERENVTFRLRSDLVKKFKDQCKANKVKTTHVIEELMLEFIGKGS